MSKPNIQELWRRLQDAPERERIAIINSMNKEDLEKLRTAVNPYKKPVYQTGQCETLGFYVINMAEKYNRRLMMTSLVGFLYRMLDEYEVDPPEETNLLSERDYKFADLFEKKASALEYERTLAKYDAEAEAAKPEDVVAADLPKDKKKGKSDKSAVVVEVNAGNKERLMAQLLKQKYMLSKGKLTDKDGRRDDAEYKRLRKELRVFMSTKEISELNFTEVDLVDDDMEMIVAEVKKELGITQTLEEYQLERRLQVQHFLDSYLKWNPDEHVRAGYKPNYDDNTRTPLEDTNAKDVKERNYERLFVPPDDTFARWQRYHDDKYEYLRQATDDIYNEKSDFEFAIAPVKIFKGASFDECETKYKEFEKKYANEMEVDLRNAKFCNWTLLDAWLGNRERINYYNENTELLERIINQAKDDARIGQRLMKKRVEKGKKQNPTPNPVGYTPPSDLGSFGVKKVDDIKMPDIVKTDVPNDPEELPNDKVEIDVHHIYNVADMKRRRFRTKAEQWKLHIAAEKSSDQELRGTTPADKYKE